MNRRLIVMRHAKSSWKNPGQSDHERPLNGRGRRSAPLVAARLHQLGWSPEAVYSSDSARTVETWRRMVDTLGGDDVPVFFTRDLYLAGLAELRAVARTWSDALGTVIVLGHNPGWEDAVSTLTGTSASMTTANAALLEGSGASWPEALAGAWRLDAMILPRDLEEGADG